MVAVPWRVDLFGVKATDDEATGNDMGRKKKDGAQADPDMPSAQPFAQAFIPGIIKAVAGDDEKRVQSDDEGAREAVFVGVPATANMRAERTEHKQDEHRSGTVNF